MHLRARWRIGSTQHQGACAVKLFLVMIILSVAPSRRTVMDSENLMRTTSEPVDERPPGLDVGQADNPRDAWTEPRRTPKTSERVALDIVQDIVGRGLRI